MRGIINKDKIDEDGTVFPAIFLLILPRNRKEKYPYLVSGRTRIQTIRRFFRAFQAIPQ